MSFSLGKKIPESSVEKYPIALQENLHILKINRLIFATVIADSALCVCFTETKSFNFLRSGQ